MELVTPYFSIYSDRFVKWERCSKYDYYVMCFIHAVKIIKESYLNHLSQVYIIHWHHYRIKSTNCTPLCLVLKNQIQQNNINLQLESPRYEEGPLPVAECWVPPPPLAAGPDPTQSPVTHHCKQRQIVYLSQLTKTELQNQDQPTTQ